MRLWPFEAIAPKDRRVEPESLPHPSGKNRTRTGSVRRPHARWQAANFCSLPGRHRADSRLGLPEWAGGDGNGSSHPGSARWDTAG